MTAEYDPNPRPFPDSGFRRAPGTSGLYLRDDNAQIWADTYQPLWHARLPGSGGLGTDGLPVREATFYTYAAAERWVGDQAPWKDGAR